MRLFDERGYRETSMEQIATAVGMPTSGIYRYFSGKSDILATAMRRAADRISGELSMILGADDHPREVLTRLIEAYVATSFANPELAFVYYAERVNLAPADRSVAAQRAEVDDRLVGAACDVSVGRRSPARKRGSACTRRWRSSSTSADWCATTTRRTRRRACDRLMELTLLGPLEDADRQIAAVTEQSDHAELARLRHRQGQAEHGLDCPVHVDVLLGVIRKRDGRDVLEHLRLHEVRHADAGDTPDQHTLTTFDIGRPLRRWCSRSTGIATRPRTATRVDNGRSSVASPCGVEVVRPRRRAIADREHRVTEQFGHPVQIAVVGILGHLERGRSAALHLAEQPVHVPHLVFHRVEEVQTEESRTDWPRSGSSGNTASTRPGRPGTWCRATTFRDCGRRAR